MFLYTKYCPAEEGDAAQQFEEGGGEGEDCRCEDEVVGHRGQGSIEFEHIAEGGDDEVEAGLIIIIVIIIIIIVILIVIIMGILIIIIIIIIKKNKEEEEKLEDL